MGIVRNVKHSVIWYDDQAFDIYYLYSSQYLYLIKLF